MALSSKIAIRLRTDGQRGLFAIQDVKAGDILVTYDGPIIDCPTRYSIQIDEDKHIEGTEESNAFLNHSCSPNAYVDWNGVCLRALRDIMAGEEVTCNYLTTDWELHEKFVCRCGAPNCYGAIRGLKYLSPQQQFQLRPFLPPFMRRKISLVTT